MNAMYKTVVFLATTVAVFFGFVPLAMADLEPPDKIVVPRFPGKAEQWVVTSTIFFEDSRVAKPFNAGFIYGEKTLPGGGLIPGPHNKRLVNLLTVKTHSTGGYTIDLKSMKSEAKILAASIEADGPNGRHWYWHYGRTQYINKIKDGL